MREHHAGRCGLPFGFAITFGNDRPYSDGNVRAVTGVARHETGTIIGGDGALTGIDEIRKTIGQAEITSKSGVSPSRKKSPLRSSSVRSSAGA
jgi:hypothetical protein